MANIVRGWYFMIRNDAMYDSCIVRAKKPWLDCVYVYEDGGFNYDKFGSLEYSNISEWPKGTFRKVDIPADLSEME